ncbi:MULTISPECIES: DUF2274 domain-containing protein [Bradyrhizobium]|uniref:DUF2274 domain-containing protein n=1 Tax=Bradyrhizobium TaxID=374 RepID=UPI0004B81C3B|nr:MULTISPECIES: DUF2274 domain-containing protein [Bradyrhizobium]
MTKLKLGPLEDDKPVKVTIELPAAVFRDLKSYAEILTRGGGATTLTEPAKLIAPMIERFMVFAVRTCETNCRILRREDFWFIVATRSEDEAEIRTGQSAGRTSYKGH